MSDSKIKHVAVIMDGNGRWAQERSHKRVWGHIRGSSIVSDIVEAASDHGLKSLTLYAFSTENWSRPSFEITVLFGLLKKFLLKERKRIIKNNIKFAVIGDISGLPKDTIKLIEDLTNETKDFAGLNLNFAFGYGSRREITESVNIFIKNNPGKQITELDIAQNLYNANVSEIDLLIRTGGDSRISNFLLWQIAYAELFFTETKWPDFTPAEFIKIVDYVGTRERRFGGVGDYLSFQKTTELAKENKTKLSQGSGHV